MDDQLDRIERKLDKLLHLLGDDKKDMRGGNATRLGKVNIIQVIGNIFEGRE